MDTKLTRQFMYWTSESVINSVGELRSIVVVFGNVGRKNSRKIIGTGWVVVSKQQIRLLGLESY